MGTLDDLSFLNHKPAGKLGPVRAEGDRLVFGDVEALGSNPRYNSNWVDYIAVGQAYGKPVSITEWNVPYPKVDRFTAPLYMASISALQGWDAPMIYNYSQRAFSRPTRPGTWSSFTDPSLCGLMPAAALLYRRGDVAEAEKTYCLMLDREDLYGRDSHPRQMAALRTLVEQSKLTIGLPDTEELDWDGPPEVASGVTVVTDPDQDFLPPGATFVRSDTSEVARNWEKGIQLKEMPPYRSTQTASASSLMTRSSMKRQMKGTTGSLG